MKGFKTHREPNNGSWYINGICEIFASRAHDTDLESMLKLIGQLVAKNITEDGHVQTSSNTDYGFYKKFYFNPGYYE